MRLHWTMRASAELWSPHPPEQVAERLREAVAGGLLTGRVDETTCSLRHHLPGRRNSWRPVFRGELLADDGGTRLRISASPHPFVVAFTFLHAIPFLGLSWVMGVAGFSWEFPTGLAGLAAVADAAQVGPDAPALAVDLRAGGGALRLPGPGKTLELGAQGLLWEDGALVALPWQEVAGVVVEDGALVVQGPEAEVRGRLAAPGAPGPALARAAAIASIVATRARAALGEGADPGRAVEATLRKLG